MGQWVRCAEMRQCGSGGKGRRQEEKKGQQDAEKRISRRNALFLP